MDKEIVTNYSVCYVCAGLRKKSIDSKSSSSLKRVILGLGNLPVLFNLGLFKYICYLYED
ncbi:hypothetical protein QE439_000674 [Pedobacter agri]|nr:hypothetical protein [Pedobacter agri]